MAEHPATARTTLLKLSPLLAPFALLFLGGLFLAGAQSLGFLLPFPHQGGRWDAYATLLQPRYLGSLGLSLYVALAAASVSVTLGALIGYGIWRLPLRMQSWATLYKVPLVLPHIAVAFIVLVLWSRTGFLASAAFHLGWIDAPEQFPNLLYGGSGLGMVMAYVYKETPFMVLLSVAVLKRLDPRLLQTAHMLGASRAMAFRRIVLPHLAPVAHTVFIILFLYTFGAFEIPFLLGESAPGMLSVEAFNLYFRRDLGNRPVAMAILVCMVLFSIVFIVAYTRLVARLGQKERKL